MHSWNVCLSPFHWYVNVTRYHPLPLSHQISSSKARTIWRPLKGHVKQTLRNSRLTKRSYWTVDITAKCNALPAVNAWHQIKGEISGHNHQFMYLYEKKSPVYVYEGHHQRLGTQRHKLSIWPAYKKTDNMTSSGLTTLRQTILHLDLNA